MAKLDKKEISLFKKLIDRHTTVDGKVNQTEIAKELGLPRTTVQSRIYAVESGKYDNIEFPDFDSEEESIDEIRERAKARYRRKRSAHDAKQWFTIKLNEEIPYGILWFGDPHLDDDGANWDLVEEHVEIATQEGIYGANIGDTTNRWVGRLMTKYADQSITWSEADRLADWFMHESGVSWLVWLLGNHDLWNRGHDFYKRLGASKIPIIDWRAQFKIKHPTGKEIKIDAAHGRKGTSMYNELHGTLREAKMGDEADLYVTGHTHNYGMQHLEIASRQRVCWLLQLRGYKEMDEYALVKGFPEHRHGAAILVIIDPRKGARNIIHHCFEDVEAGAKYLKYIRKEARSALDTN